MIGLKGFVVSLTLMLLSAMPGPVLAHFNLNQNVRIFHVVHDEDGLMVLLRTPMAYVVADKLGQVGADGRPAPAPFTYNEFEGDVLMHLVDQKAVNLDLLGLAGMIAQELVLEVEGLPLKAEPLATRVYPIGEEPSFATRAEALFSFSDSEFRLDSPQGIYVGDAVVDVKLFFPGAPVPAYKLSVRSDPGLPGQVDTANLILDYRSDQVRTYRASGLLATPVHVTGSASTAASTFVVEGARHIVEGIDHVLFVLCMVIGAVNPRALLARVTGFTLGHSVTLIMGFFGIAPSAPWFIPAVETAIAVSIILAAADAVFQRSSNAQSNIAVVGVTGGIGLLHGFGFSFMLREILQVDAPNVWQSLLAFNIGVELGQLVIVALIWPLVVLLRRMPSNTWVYARGAMAASISVIAAIWAFERVAGVLA